MLVKSQIYIIIWSYCSLRFIYNYIPIAGLAQPSPNLYYQIFATIWCVFISIHHVIFTFTRWYVIFAFTLILISVFLYIEWRLSLPKFTFHSLDHYTISLERAKQSKRLKQIIAWMYKLSVIKPQIQVKWYFKWKQRPHTIMGIAQMLK